MKKYLVFSAVAMLLFMPLMVLAQLPTVPVSPAGGVTLPEAERLIERVATFFIFLGLVLAVIFVVYGGIVWMNAGSDETKIKNAKLRIRQGVYGGLIVIGVGVILRTLSLILARTFFG